MFEFICGIAVGAAFSPFWMMVWGYLKDQVTSRLGKK